MLEAKFNDAATFRKIIDSLREIIKEGNFECNESGISFQGVDTTFVALVQLTIRTSGFDHFRIDNTMNLGINIENLSKLLKCGGAKDSLTLVAQEDSDKLTLTFESPERTARFDHRLMVIDADSLGVPAMQYNTVAKINSNEFQRIVRDLGTIGDIVEICISKSGLKFSVEGTTGGGHITLTPSDGDNSDDCVKIKAEDTISQKFPLRYLASFSKAAPLSTHVNLMMSEEAPLGVEYKMTDPSDSSRSIGFIRFFLAPKAEEEQE